MRNPYRVLAVCSLAASISLQVVAGVPDGEYVGTIKCQPGEGSVGQAQWAAPVQLKVKGAQAIWSRDSATTRETIKSSAVNDEVRIDGYGGNYSANFQRAMQWDWKTEAVLGLRDGMLGGRATISTKDGRIVNWRCTVAINVGPVPAEQPTVAVAPIAELTQTVVAGSPQREGAGVVGRREGRDAATQQADVQEKTRERTARPQVQIKVLDRSAASPVVRRPSLQGEDASRIQAPARVDDAVARAEPASGMSALNSKPSTEPPMALPSPVPVSVPAAAAADRPATSSSGTSLNQPVERVNEPASASASIKAVSSSATKPRDGLTAKQIIALLVGALLFGSMAYRTYPRFFQANAELYYRSAWDRLKRRVTFAAAWAAGGGILCMTVATR